MLYANAVAVGTLCYKDIHDPKTGTWPHEVLSPSELNYHTTGNILTRASPEAKVL